MDEEEHAQHQCDNCSEWFESLEKYSVEYPSGEYVKAWICGDCLDHLVIIREVDPSIEVGSVAAQRS